LVAQPYDVHERFVGVEFPIDLPLYQGFVERLEFVLPHAPLPHGYNILYDAIYMLTYAVYAAGVTNLTPEKLRDGLTRIDKGLPITVGTDGNSFAEGIGLLQISGEADAFEFRGTTGPLTWLNATGSRVAKIPGTYCLQRDATGAGVYAFGRRLYNLESMQFVDAQGNPVPQTQGACFPVP
jgi:hypothetical protein